jgi:hypothetical protein
MKHMKFVPAMQIPVVLGDTTPPNVTVQHKTDKRGLELLRFL